MKSVLDKERGNPALRTRTNSCANEIYFLGKITIKRLNLIRRSRTLNDVMVVLALGGLILGIVVNQLITSNAFGDNSWNHPALIAMRSLISVSTLALIIINIIYQYISFKLWLLDRPNKPFLVVVKFKMCAIALIELLVCAVHPIPWDFDIQQTEISMTPPYFEMTTINVNVFLTIAMFVRMYLVFRAVLQHHPLCNSNVLYVLLPWNRVDIGYKFLFKLMMEKHASVIVSSFLLLIWLTGAWMLMHCDNATGGPLSNYSNALWFIIVTLTTVSTTQVHIVLKNIKCHWLLW